MPVTRRVRFALAASLVTSLAGGAVTFAVATELGIRQDVAGPTASDPTARIGSCS